MMKDNFFQRSMGDFVVTPGMLNQLNILHGGELVKHLDSTMGIFVSEYNHSLSLTGRIDRLCFNKRLYLNEHVNFSITLLKTTNHTMIVHAFINLIDLNNNSERVGEAIFTFVAVNDNFEPIPVKPFTPIDLSQKQFINAKLKQLSI